MTPGWLKEILEENRENVASWPAWKRIRQCHDETEQKGGTMERYRDNGQVMSTDPDGSWVKHFEVEAQVTALTQERDMWQEIAGLRFAGDHKFVKEMELLKIENVNLQSALDAEREKVEVFKQRLGLDCGDHSCLYAITKTGMRTNGGCRCDPKRTKEDLLRSRKACDDLQQQIDAEREKAAQQGRYAVELFDEIQRMKKTWAEERRGFESDMVNLDTTLREERTRREVVETQLRQTIEDVLHTFDYLRFHRTAGMDGSLYESHNKTSPERTIEATERRLLVTLTAAPKRTAPSIDERRFIEACCEAPHDCKWGAAGGCGYEGRKHELDAATHERVKEQVFTEWDGALRKMAGTDAAPEVKE